MKTFIRSFQFKVLDDLIYTNVELAKIGYVPKDTCTFCEVDSKTVLHIFYECPFKKTFLKRNLKTFGLHSQMNTKSSFATRRVHWEVREN